MTEKVIIVTGANGDIGKPLAIELLAHGFSVVACVRDKALTDFDENDQLKVFECDFSSEESMLSCVKLIRKEYKSIYGLVNCVGVAHGGSFLLTKLEEMKEVFSINYFSILFFTQQVVRKMIKSRSGSIVNLSSTAGILSDKGTLAYGASKAALIHSTKVMATELGAFGIRVNAIAPAVVESKMAEIMDQESVDLLNSRAALPTKIYPKEVVDMVLYLLSESAANITGQIVKIDRGITN